MDLTLQPQADTCFVTQTVFTEGVRVVSFLVRDPGGEFRRYDCLVEAEGSNLPPGEVLCRWTRIYKPRVAGMDAERELKMSAESLFLSLTDDGSGDVSENSQLKQFLALMLERKRVLKNRGRSIGGNLVYEHMRSKRMIEVPSGEMDVEFFMSVREKLGLLIKDTPAPSAQPVAPLQSAPAPQDTTPATPQALELESPPPPVQPELHQQPEQVEPSRDGSQSASQAQQ